MSRNYSIKAIEDFIANHCVDCLFQGDSVVGLGNQVWLMNNGRYFIVKEYFINCWTSGHKVRQVSKLSKRLQDLCNNAKENLLLQD